MKSNLALVRDAALPAPPAERGRIMEAHEVSIELLQGKLSARSVRRHVPGKFFLGHNTPVWFEQDVKDWLRTLRAEGNP